MKSALFVALTFGFGCLCLGCSGKSACESVCEKSADCEGATQDKDNCADDCKSGEDDVKSADCTDEYNDMMDCMDGVADVCSEEEIADSCAAEGLKFFACTMAYCIDHPDSEVCQFGQ